MYPDSDVSIFLVWLRCPISNKFITKVLFYHPDIATLKQISRARELDIFWGKWLCFHFPL